MPLLKSDSVKHCSPKGPQARIFVRLIITPIFCFNSIDIVWIFVITPAYFGIFIDFVSSWLFTEF